MTKIELFVLLFFIHSLDFSETLQKEINKIDLHIYELLLTLGKSDFWALGLKGVKSTPKMTKIFIFLHNPSMSILAIEKSEFWAPGVKVVKIIPKMTKIAKFSP